MLIRENLFLVWMLVILVLFNSILAKKIKREIGTGSEDLNPISQSELNEDTFGGQTEVRGDREKRLGVVKTIGLKAVLLNLIFGKIDQLIDWKTRQINELDKQNIAKNRKYFGITPPPKRPPKHGGTSSSSVGQQTGTNQEVLNFPTNSPVSLDIPGELYGNSFKLVSNVSEIIGNVLFNSAARAQEFVDRTKQIVRHKFGFATRFIRTSGPKTRNKKSEESR